MRVLIVGAGAVGQVYGRHLQLGGAEVTFFVREKYLDDCAKGFAMYPLNRPRAVRTEPILWTDFDAIHTVDQVRAGGFDQVWLAVSSTALRLPWLPELLEAAGDAVVVGLTPGPDDQALLLEHVGPDRLVAGLINLISYPAPLPGETRFPRPGMAYWFPVPALAGSPFQGPKAHVDAVVGTLKAGGQPAQAVSDLTSSAAYGNLLFTPHLLALEAADWSFERTAREGWLSKAALAARESVEVLAHERGERPPFIRHFVRPGLIRLLMTVAPRVIPMDIETYLGYHFTKVGDQTRLFVDTTLARAARAGIDASALQGLREAVDHDDARVEAA